MNLHMTLHHQEKDLTLSISEDNNIMETSLHVVKREHIL